MNCNLSFRDDYDLSKNDLRDDSEKLIFKTINDNDVQKLKEMLTNPCGYRLGFKEVPILSIAVLKGAHDVIKFLIDQGCDLREIDKNGNSVFHFLVSGCKFYQTEEDLLDMFLASYSNAAEAVFLNKNKRKTTPFFLACGLKCHGLILRFLSFLDNKSMSIDKFIGPEGNTVFHFLLGRSTKSLPPTLLETVQMLIDKIPFS